MNNELEDLNFRGTQEVDCPDIDIMGSQRVLTIKCYSDGTVKQYEVDFFETFSLTWYHSVISIDVYYGRNLLSLKF